MRKLYSSLNLPNYQNVTSLNNTKLGYSVMMGKDEKNFDELVQELIFSLCPYLSEEERKEEEQRFKDYLGIVWEIFNENYGGFDRNE